MWSGSQNVLRGHDDRGVRMAGTIMIYGTLTERDTYIDLPDAERIEVHDDGGIAFYAAEPERGAAPGADVYYPPGTWRDARILGQERVYSEWAWETGPAIEPIAT
jgi:hypothetical protein